MKSIASALRKTLLELWGLFVEDGSFTIGILACLGLAMFVFPRFIADAYWRGPLLFGALALMLLENVYRSARQ